MADFYSAVDNLAPGFGNETAAMIREFSDLTILLDHLAEPGMGNAVDYVDILRLANHDNIYMKLSGMNHVSTQAPLYQDIKPFTRTVIEAFGPDKRVVGIPPSSMSTCPTIRKKFARRERARRSIACCGRENARL